MENQFDTDEQLRNALGDFEAIPDSGSFDAILEKMNRKKKRRLFIIFFWTGLIALSGITVPLMLGFYNTAKPSALNTTKTKTIAPVHHKTTTDSTHTFLTVPGLHEQQASTPSTGQVSPSDTLNPESNADPAGSHHTNSGALAVTSSSSPEKTHAENKSAKPTNIPGSVVTGPNPEPNHKANSNIASSEKAGTAPNASSENKTGDRIPEALASTATAPELMYMTVIQIPLPLDSIRQDISASLKETSYPARFMAPEKKNTLSFYLGAQASPQLNGFAFSKNPNKDPGYSTSMTNFPEFYLKAKQDQSHFNFSLPFGIKAGLQINKRYEVLAGFGYQSFHELEKLHAVEHSTITSTVDPGIAYHAAADFSAPYKNQFRYLYYSLEANRLFQTSKAMGFKVGLGVYGNQLINSNYVYAVSPGTYGQMLRGEENLSPWLLTAKVKAGMIFNANRRFQFHISPGFFYSPTSIFKKEYVIRQKPYGVDVECLLLFRLFKI